MEIDLLFLRSSCTFVIKKSGKIRETKNYFLKILFFNFAISCNFFACFSFYFYPSQPIEMSLEKI